ncbi:Uncharacterised protein [Mycobacterium tuberculosis]|uniref:Uncharacterized protein n=1 Tax=Mycobacterium tuberculosis TaxID=1773 RepID=A0A654ZRB1_MYCTX|nr:Uncharacterised protein [Mycobacterium tuberculosis]
MLIEIARDPDHRHPGHQGLLGRQTPAIADHHGRASRSGLTRQVVRHEGVGRHGLQVTAARGGRDHRHRQLSQRVQHQLQQISPAGRAQGCVHDRPVGWQRIPPCRRLPGGRPQDRAKVLVVGRQVVGGHQLGHVSIQGVVPVGENAAQVPPQTRQPVPAADPVERHALQGEEQRAFQAVEELDQPDAEQAGPYHVGQRKTPLRVRTPVGIRDRDVRNAGQSGADRQ